MSDGAVSRGRAFAALIVGARKRKGWTQEHLEAASGVTQRTIARWEAGQASRPEPEAVRAVCIALDLDPRDAAVALGYLTPDEVTRSGGMGFAPSVAEVVRILQDDTIDPDIKDEWISYLRWRVAEQRARENRRNRDAL